MKPAQPAPKDGPRINEEIRVREVQLIDQTGHNHGPIDFQIALQKAQEAGLDLVEIAPNSSPPVCKILDYGKYKYQAQKKAAEARKKQKVVEVKEIKLRPMIDDHDYDVKMRSMQRFFEEGDKVKVTLAISRARDGAPGARLSTAQSRQRRHVEDRQSRAGAAVRRATGGDGARAALKAGAAPRLPAVEITGPLCHKRRFPPPGREGCRGAAGVLSSSS